MTQTLIAGLYIIKTDEDGKLLIFLPQPEGKKNGRLFCTTAENMPCSSVIPDKT